ncbi:MAG: heme lyase CcmF/NrfE family subunit [Zoogloeaceae bacterium]|jgi:cytochrome c-type biogenesis protein CcmF|nr:heme lyase CcmF/NrfE family subunit [Zoogloeaceae bacterium]
MIPELGHFALILAVPVSLFAGVLALLGAHGNDPRWIALARPGARLIAFLLTLAYAALTYAFAVNDFSVRYVAEHSNSLLPLPYRIAAVWGGHEGSLLLWALMLAWWACAVSFFSGRLAPAMRARVLGTLALVAFGFLLFILCTSNPFLRLLPAAPEGRDLNPLLQDPGLIIHPPLLYMGYVGFSIAYAFAVAALLAGRLDAAWARWSRPWTTMAWVFLTLGIVMGSWWAYCELGWGGWWFWDPVENASFMPWLVGTALIHSLAVTEKRGSFRNWTVLLAISTFSLSLLGTFLVRSGVLTSVHAFAADPARGIFILVFLAIVAGASLLLFVWRAPRVGLGGRFALFSRESLLLANNVLLVVAASTVLLGTLYPLLIDALGQGKISVGPPYFNTVFVPIMLPLLFLIGLGPFVRWKRDDWREIIRVPGGLLLLAIFIATLLVGLKGSPAIRIDRVLLLPFLVVFSLTLALWIAFAAFFHLFRQAKAGRGAGGRVAAFIRQPLHFWGMHLAHLGVAVFVAGVAIVGGYAEEKDVKMAPGDTVTLAGHSFRFLGVREVEGPNYTALRGDMEVRQGARLLRHLYPEKRFYRSSAMPMTEAAIDAGFWRDLYVSLGEPIDRANPAGEWAVRVYEKPLIGWIWAGCLLMAAGGFLAALDRRYRKRLPAAASAPLPPSSDPA